VKASVKAARWLANERGAHERSEQPKPAAPASNKAVGRVLTSRPAALR
jgi:hypothetical protein